MVVGTLLALVLGVLATIAALRARRGLVATLGEGYVPRFVGVQGVLINGALWAVVLWVANWVELPTSIAAQLVLAAVYGAVFYFYSISNIDWTAKKFHDREVEE